VRLPHVIETVYPTVRIHLGNGTNPDEFALVEILRQVRYVIADVVHGDGVHTETPQLEPVLITALVGPDDVKIPHTTAEQVSVSTHEFGIVLKRHSALDLVTGYGLDQT
jgi:hypothetical protein